MIPNCASSQSMPQNDSLVVVRDSIMQDTITPVVSTADNSDGLLDAQVDYDAKDSILFDVVNQKVFMYGEAIVIYKDITLKADYIELDLDKNIVFAE